MSATINIQQNSLRNFLHCSFIRDSPITLMFLLFIVLSLMSLCLIMRFKEADSIEGNMDTVAPVSIKKLIGFLFIENATKKVFAPLFVALTVCGVSLTA